MKKLLAIILVVFILLTTTATAFASTYGDPTAGNNTQQNGYWDSNGNWIQNNQQNGYWDSNGNWIQNNQQSGYYDSNGNLIQNNNQSQYGYSNQSWYANPVNNNQYYNGEVYSNGSGYNRNQLGQTYYLSDWTADLQNQFNNPSFFESAQGIVNRGQLSFLMLRGIQDTLSDRGYARLQADFQKPPFWDLDQLVYNAQSELNILHSKGIIVGYLDNTVKFSNAITKAEAAAIYARLNRLYLNMPATYVYTPFNDTRGHWAEQEIAQAVACGVLKGVGNNKFDPDAPLTIEQVWAIVSRFVGQNGIKVENVADAMNLTFNCLFKGPYDETYTGNDWNNNGQRITSLSMKQSNISMKVTEERTISCGVYPTNLTNVRLDWRSSNTSAISIEDTWYSSGIAYAKIKARRNALNVKITVKTQDGSNKIGTTNVSVEDSNNNNYETEVTRLEAVNSNISINQGDTEDVSVRIIPSTADNKILTWKSSNSNVALIQNTWNSGSYGYATIKGVRNGNATLRVETTDGSYITINITVNVVDGNNNNYDILVSDINIGNQNISIRVDESFQASASVYPPNATNRNINWSSSNNSIAIVNSSGNITGRQNGNCVITVSSQDGSNVSKQYNLTVIANQINDTVAPVIEFIGSPNIKIGQFCTLTVRASDNVGVVSFIVRIQDVKGDITGLLVTGSEKVGDEYKVTFKGVLPGQFFFGIDQGVAKDAAGNSSDWSNECNITVTEH